MTTHAVEAISHVHSAEPYFSAEQILRRSAISWRSSAIEWRDKAHAALDSRDVRAALYFAQQADQCLAWSQQDERSADRFALMSRTN